VAVDELRSEIDKLMSRTPPTASEFPQVVLNDGNAKVRFEALRALIWRVEPDVGAEAIDDVIARGDLELLTEAVRARRRSVPAVLRARATEVLAA
jgi:hypothetical protein